jgi:formyl-CoA transferase
VSNADRLANQESLVTEIERALASRTVDEWVDRLLAEGIPCGPILDYAQVFDSPHTAARRMVELWIIPLTGPFERSAFR